MQITAAVLRKPFEPFTIEQVDLAEPQADEILVRIVAVGLCHSDVAVQQQSLPVALPAVLGHEGGGIVEKVGASVTKVKPGDKVVLTMASCGTCENCARGEPMYCENIMAMNYSGVRPDGSHTVCCGGTGISAHYFGQSSFASYALANERNTVKVDDDAPLDLVAPLGCGIQTGAGAVMRSLSALPGRSIAVYGGGSVGMSAVMGAVIQGCTPIIAVEPVAARRALALELGATHAIDPAAGDVAAQIRAIVPRGTDYAVDTTAAVPVLEAAMAALAPHGAMAWLGVPKDPASAISLSLIGFLTSGATIKAVIEGDSFPDDFIPELLAHYKAGRLPLEKLVKTYPFAQINEAIADQLSGRTLKPVLLL